MSNKASSCLATTRSVGFGSAQRYKPACKNDQKAAYAADRAQEHLFCRISHRGNAPRGISGPKIVLEPKSAQSIAMILHELTTNAVKYGALSVPSGRLLVEWSRGESEIVIRWSEVDGPPVKTPTHQGFGTRVSGPVIQTGLEGRLRFDWNPDGLCCEIAIPLAALRTPSELGCPRPLVRSSRNVLASAF